MSKNQKSISYIYVKSYGAHPVGCIGSTTFDAIAEASAVYQLGTSFVGTVVNDLETDVQGVGEVLPLRSAIQLRTTHHPQVSRTDWLETGA